MDLVGQYVIICTEELGIIHRNFSYNHEVKLTVRRLVRGDIPIEATKSEILKNHMSLKCVGVFAGSGR